MKICGLSLDATTHYNQWVRINKLNGLESSAAAVGLRSVFAARVRLMRGDLALVARVSGRANCDISGITDEKVGAKRVCGDEVYEHCAFCAFELPGDCCSEIR